MTEASPTATNGSKCVVARCITRILLRRRG
jgi:hypothetical protein